MPSTTKPNSYNIYSPGPDLKTVRSSDGKIVPVPEGWELLTPGDAALTRRVKKAGEHWMIQEKKGRRTFSKGVWAPATTITRIREELELERSTESYSKRKAADAQRRAKLQAEYVESFYQTVLSFLNFHPDYKELAEQMAHAITQHATPVGSGTVARTKRIPVEQRAEAAAIAWMRHQTTAYDSMSIPRVKGKRREVRRMLAQRSNELLSQYRRGKLTSADCPLQQAIKEIQKGE